MTVGFSTGSSLAEEDSLAARVIVALSSPSEAPVALHVATAGITAIEGEDFLDGETDVLFAPGQVSAEVTVTLVSDELDEPDESFAVEIMQATGATLDAATHEVTIAEHKALPYVFVEGLPTTQPESMSPTLVFKLTEPTDLPVQVTYAVSGTASAADVQLQAGTVTIEPGELQVELELGVVNDDIDETEEMLVVTIASASNAKVGSAFAYTHTITDDDLPPTVLLEQYPDVIDEGNSGSKLVEFKVHLSSPSAAEISVPFDAYATDGTASSDYTVMTASPLVFAPGVTTMSIWFELTGDTIVEGDDAFVVALMQPMVQPNVLQAWLSNDTWTKLDINDDDCLGTGMWTVCPDDAIAADVVIPTGISSHASCNSNAPLNWVANGQPQSACFIIARNITISDATLFGYPFILVATENITITGTLAVRSWSWPNGSEPPCAPYSSTPEARAGGAGGSFMTAGGNGGAHTSPIAIAGVATAADVTAPTKLRGGCNGQMGGGTTNPSDAFGWGGGAIYLVAGTSITLQPNAAINASGMSALGSLDSSMGGSGGGSGGMIYLHAPTITATNAFLTANGGAGSEGATGSLAGQNGVPPDPRTPLVPAAGGSGTTGGDGGSGFAQGSPATSGSPASSTNGAGGGGGGAGYIHANQPLTGAGVSPAPS